MTLLRVSDRDSGDGTLPESAPPGVNGTLYRLAAQVQRMAILIILVAVVGTGVAAYYTAQHLVISTSTLDMISRDVQFRRNDMAMRAAFPNFVDPIAAVVEAETPEAAEAAAARLEDRLRQSATHLRRIARPGSGPYFEREGLLFLDPAELAELGDRLAAAQPLLAEMAREPNLRGLDALLETIAANPEAASGAELAALLDRMATTVRAVGEGRPRSLSWQALFSPETPSERGQYRRVLLIQPDFDEDAFKPAEPAMNEIRRLAREVGIGNADGTRLRLTGPAALDHEELESVELGGRLAGVLSLTLVSLLLIVGLRSWVLVLAAVGTLVVGLIWTAGFATLAVGRLNLISVAFAVLFVGLGIDFGIHLCLRYREEAIRLGDRTRAIRIATAAVGVALFLSAVSAAAGFYSFLPTDYLGLAELGLIAGSGMFIALGLSLTLLPALLTLLPFPGGGAVAEPRTSEDASSNILQRRSGLVLGLAIVVGLAGAALLPFLRFDFNPINLTDPSMPSVSTFLEMAADPESGVYTAEMLAEDLEAGRALEDRLEVLPEVGRVLTIESFVPDHQEEKLRIIADMALFLGPVVQTEPGKVELPPEQLREALRSLRTNAASLASRASGETAAAAERLAVALTDIGEAEADVALLARLNRSLAGNIPAAVAGLRTALGAEPVGMEDLPPELTQFWVTDDGRIRVKAWPARPLLSNREMEAFADAVLATAPTATGVPIVVSEAGAAVIDAFVEASLIALAAITLILAVALRRPSEVLMVLAPLVLAAILSGATTVALGLSLNFANVIALPLLLGLGVSSGIQLVVRRRQMSGDGDLMNSSTPRAVLFSALTTVASFGSLAISGHRGMMSMGLLLTIAIVWTLVATLIVLPALMHKLPGRTDA